MTTAKWLLTGLTALALGIAYLLYRRLARKRCRYCDGKGEMPIMQPGGMIWVDCPHCNP